MTRLYEVTAKCGHVGKANYISITFPCYAENGKEAAEMVRWFPRVKHHHKDAIQSVREISREEYGVLQYFNDVDPYLHCKNSQDQQQISDLSCRLQKENELPQFSKNKRSPLRYQKAVLDEKEMRAVIRLYLSGVQQITI